MEVYNLLDFDRLPDGISLVPIVLYFPLGVILATVRFFISLHALIVSFILPKTWFLRSLVLRFLFAVAGIIISTDGDENKDQRARVVVCNHISPLDHLITSLVFPHICILDWHSSPFLRMITGCLEISPTKNKDEVVKYVKSLYVETPLPLVFFPEKTTTNGKLGLLKYWSLPFELGHLIQPVTIQARRIGVFQINVSTAHSVWWKDYLWCLFSPYTIFKLRYLPITEKKESESCEEFSERVRQNMCKSLGVRPTPLTHSDKTELLKKKQLPPFPARLDLPVPNDDTNTTSAVSAEEPSTSSSSLQPKISASAQKLASADPQVKAMVEQVKMVLPHVPLLTIITEIESSRDVDIAISNILEGNIEFTPEEVSPVNSETTQVKSSPCPSQVMFKAQNFGKNANYRHMSLAERKQEMYELARQKYKEKHNML